MNKNLVKSIKITGRKVDQFSGKVWSMGDAEKRSFSTQLARATREETAHIDTSCQFQALPNHGS